VLISGSFRNFNEIWPHNKLALDRLNIEYDVFFHTWRSNPSLDLDVLDNIYNNKFYFSPFTKKFKPFIELIDEQYISDQYNFRIVKVEDFDEIAIATKFNLGTPELNPLFRSQLNSCGMYLGIDSTYQSLKINNTYTHFLRLRPDFILATEGLEEIFTNDLVFFGQLLPTPEGPIGDQSYGGLISKSDFILNTLSQLKIITSAKSWNKPKSSVLAENVIRQHLAPFRNSLKILYLDNHGAIGRPGLELADQPLTINGLTRIFVHNFSTAWRKAKRLIK
jgi:hypothetical protein